MASIIWVFFSFFFLFDVLSFWSIYLFGLNNLHSRAAFLQQGSGESTNSLISTCWDFHHRALCKLSHRDALPFFSFQTEKIMLRNQFKHYILGHVHKGKLPTGALTLFSLHRVTAMVVWEVMTPK
jgi:hypothetical protein